MLAAWALLAAATCGLGSVYINQFRQEREAAAYARAGVAAEALEQTLLRSVEAIEGVISLTQTRENLLYHGDTAGATGIADYLRGISRQEKFGVLQVSTIGADGWMTWSTTHSDAPLWLGDRDHYKVHRDGMTGLYISKPLIGRASHRWSVQFTRPLVKPDGSFGGVTVVSFDPIQLSNTLASLRFGDGSISAVLSLPQGYLLARSADAANQLGRPAMPDLPVLVAAHGAPSGVLSFPSVVTHRQMMAAYRVMGTLPIVVMVGLDADRELAVVRSVAASVHATEAAVILLAAALVGVLAQRLARRRARQELDHTRRQAETAELARAHTDRLLSGLPAAVYRITAAPDGRVLGFELTETACRLTGWSTGELSTWGGWTCRIEGMPNGAWAQRLRAVIAQGEATVEYRFHHRNGAVLWLRDQARVVEGQGTGAVAIVGYVSDITRERAMQAQAVASAKLATLGEMATGLAHELNQPIAIMSLAAENAGHMLTLKGADGIPFAVARMQRITEQAGRARTIVNHLRIFGRQEEEALGPIDLDAVVTAALTLAGAALRGAGVTVDAGLPASLPPVMGQLVLAEQVVVNLLLNARDAMDSLPPDRPRRIALSVQALDPDTLGLCVSDTGPGIPPPLLDRIFEPFFTTKEVGKGTGLGLSICHGIMSSFGGTIEAANLPAGGARLTAVFRRAPVQAAPIAEMAEPA
jgi:C4-dicarboxylate-specific signal transduction histidine kinase